MADEMKLQIITPVGRFYEGDVTMAELTTTEGNIGIYPNHIPLTAVVAPGIAEALVATAIGLFAAIPAVAAYNYFNNRVGRLSNRLDGFSEEFLNILQRQQARG